MNYITHHLAFGQETRVKKSTELGSHKTVFPQLKNKFPGMNPENSWNLLQFHEIEEGHSVLV